MNLRKIDERIDSLYVEVGRWAYEKYKAHGLSGFNESETVSLLEEIELALSERNRVSADMEELRQWKMEKQGE